MRDEELLGLALECVLAMRKEQGLCAPVIEYTAAPRGAHPEGTPRVVRSLDDGARLTVAAFCDTVKEEGA